MVRSALGDDAVMLGAVALARQHVGRDPFLKRFAESPRYTPIGAWRFGEVMVGGRKYDHDIYIRVDGTVKDRKKCPRGENHKACHTVGLKEIQKVCRGGPEVLFVGAGRSSRVKVAKVAAAALQSEAIELQVAAHPPGHPGLQRRPPPQGHPAARHVLST